VTYGGLNRIRLGVAILIPIHSFSYRAELFLKQVHLLLELVNKSNNTSKIDFNLYFESSEKLISLLGFIHRSIYVDKSLLCSKFEKNRISLDYGNLAISIPRLLKGPII
jgi:hypothetical protein